MHKIIDFHIHLGDIFHENLNILFKKPYQYDSRPYADPFDDLGRGGYTTPLIVDDIDRQNTLIDAGQFRTWERGGMAAYQQMMDELGIHYMVNMPILPNSSFEEGLAVYKMDNRFLTFTCPDFDLEPDAMLDKLKKDIGKGARGLKVHPIVQNVCPTDERICKCIELFGKMGLPITVHFGINDYYRQDSPHHDKTNLWYGDKKYCFELVEKFPEFIFIPAHGGGTTGGEMEELGALCKKRGYKNVYVETSHRGANGIKTMFELFGEDRVMFSSDHPFQTIDYELFEGYKAVGDDPELAEKFFYRNAARILNI